ncbi:MULTISPECIES: aminoglycoside 6'-N-acetyltransferase [Rhizobium/Agrobacterium group]|uniref:aminoglycoside 6'-N-acetyltransferase n=1 Tax=Rhizobium/Agrobacterium group TaxID=227290 RepID=UPI00083DB008|nr:aminoglycoside 6'-N-acetyltransferase [Agrobacterium sp. RAC06]AOG10640.1 acetyltransferase family protein [Agrobacterium sp. RAC06]
MTGFRVRRATEEDLDAWASLRHQLWPHLSLEGHRTEIVDALAQPEKLVAFLCVSATGNAIGLAEASVRSDYVNGCETSPVAFLEGIVVDPSFRRQGVAASLVAAVTDWAKDEGLSELASDAEIHNTVSHAMHAALGFEETQRVVYFRKSL